MTFDGYTGSIQCPSSTMCHSTPVLNDWPQFIAIEPNVGSVNGNERVNITGKHLEGVTRVEIGGAPCKMDGSPTPTTIICTTGGVSSLVSVDGDVWLYASSGRNVIGRGVYRLAATNGTCLAVQSHESDLRSGGDCEKLGGGLAG